ncbi:hypothetical protein GPALN_006657 [Globodera pallida]|nr:hypothetical protein GPALN_006657 [Globodera pallida]
MSDHAQVQRCHFGTLKFCNEIWLAIFPYIGIAELALRMALLSDRFDDLVDAHLKKRKWTLGRLQIRRSANGDRRAEIVNRSNGTREPLPIAHELPLFNLVGFNGISIKFIDQNVMAFLHRIRRLFQTGDITLELYDDVLFNHYDDRRLSLTQQPQKPLLSSVGIWYSSCAITFHNYISRMLNYSLSWSDVTQQIWPLLAPNISRLRLYSGYYSIGQLRSRISPTVLRNCANLRSIEASNFLLPAYESFDNEAARASEAIAKWLFTRRVDGRPHVLRTQYPQKPGSAVEMLIEEFVVAFTPVSYILVFPNRAGDEPFVLENSQTRERLQRRRVNELLCLMARSPIARDEKQWAEWEREAVERNKKNVINICVSDEDVGFRLFSSGEPCSIM